MFNKPEEAIRLYDDNLNLDIIRSYILGDLKTFSPQGICVVNGYTYITMYDTNNNLNSKVVVLKDNQKFIETGLYNKAHVGGICYDYDHNVMWITDVKGNLAGYDPNELLSGKRIAAPVIPIMYCGDDLINYDGQNEAAYVAYNDHHLYVGNCSNSNGILKEFTLNRDGTVNNYKLIKFLDYVQGLTFFNKNDETYMIVSRSYGKSSKSNLLIYKYNKLVKDINVIVPKGIVLPPCLEQVYVYNNELYALYKTNMKQYKKLFEKDKEDIFVYDINKLI